MWPAAYMAALALVGAVGVIAEARSRRGGRVARLQQALSASMSLGVGGCCGEGGEGRDVELMGSAMRLSLGGKA